MIVREIKLEIETTGPKCGGAKPLIVALEKYEGRDSIVLKFKGASTGSLDQDGGVKLYEPVFVHLSQEGIEALDELLRAYLVASDKLAQPDG